jgi:hypothetical protein
VRFCQNRFSPSGELGYSWIRSAVGLGDLTYPGSKTALLLCELALVETTILVRKGYGSTESNLTAGTTMGVNSPVSPPSL